MTKWFERVDQQRPAVISSRVRLVRNLSEYVFPSRLSQEKSVEMLRRLETELKELGSVDGRHYEYAWLSQLGDLERRALCERRVFNATVASVKTPASILLSEEEEVSVVLNSTDHIRMQVMAPGLHLYELWYQADQLDDYINSKFSYAFDEKYGYLTSFPTNVGTGLRASVMLHLPFLSMAKTFSGIISEMGRFGASVRGAYGEGEENYGSLYIVSNQKTLGLTEKEILDMVSKVALQLVSQEEQLRKRALEKNGLECTDEAYKSYGVLKYARRLKLKDAMMFLSHLMTGIFDGVLAFQEPYSIYRLMLEIQPANLQKLSERPLGKEELDIARASYIRNALPELK